jgi:hypothetical protein
MKFTQYVTAGILGAGLVTGSLADSPKSIGWIEHVQVPSGNMLLTAKIDTGADNSSIHAKNVEIYERTGSKRVRFSVENKQGDSQQFDLPLVRIAYIKRKGADPLQRPVVSMDVCVGDTLKTTQVNLANRGNFNYRMLIGRSFLKDTYLVNPGQKFTAEPICKGETLAMNEAS